MAVFTAVLPNGAGGTGGGGDGQDRRHGRPVRQDATVGQSRRRRRACRRRVRGGAGRKGRTGGARPGRGSATARSVVRVRVPGPGPDNGRHQEPRGDAPGRLRQGPVQPGGTRRYQAHRGLHVRPGQRVQRLRAQVGGRARTGRVRAVRADGGRRRGDDQSGRSRCRTGGQVCARGLQAAEEHAGRTRNEIQNRLLTNGQAIPSI